MKTYLSNMSHRLIFTIFLLEFGVMGISGVWFPGLAGSKFFSLGIDPGQWLFFFAGIPPFILSHPVFAWATGLSMLIGIIWMIRDPGEYRVARVLLILFWCYYSTLTAYLGHRNFQAGMVFIFIPFLFRKNVNKQMAWEAIRYFILFFYVSAAIFKIFHTGLFEAGHMSRILSAQLAPYYVEHITGMRMSINQYLVSHATLAQLLFIFSVFIEMLPLLGFFSKKWDKLIVGSVILFHLVNWLIMDIAPIGQLSFICLILFPFNRGKS